MDWITTVMIVCGKRYADLARVSVGSFLRHHGDRRLLVVADAHAAAVLAEFGEERIKVVEASWARRSAEHRLKVAGKSSVISYDGMPHDRAWSGMKPVIMEIAVRHKAPTSKYILNVDADALFTGNIMDVLEKLVRRDCGKYDMYMVRRRDPRMLTTGGKSPGSGFVLWKRCGRYVPMFEKMFHPGMIGLKGGSQDMTNLISGKISAKFLYNPLFHFVSPDLKNPNFPDSEIRKLRPAYIHLHGANGLERLKRFRGVFMKAGLW